MAFYPLYYSPLFCTTLIALAVASEHYIIIAAPIMLYLWVALCVTGHSPLVFSGFIWREWILFSCFTRWKDDVANGEVGRLRCSHPSSLSKELLQNKLGCWGTNFCSLGSSQFSPNPFSLGYETEMWFQWPFSLKSVSCTLLGEIATSLWTLSWSFESIWKNIRLESCFHHSETVVLCPGLWHSR